MNTAVILSAYRTLIGFFGGVFKDFSASDLGPVLIREAIARAGVSATEVGVEPIRIRAAVLQAIVAHALQDAPDECCGLLVGPVPDGDHAAAGLIDEAVPATNLERSPTRYRIDPAEHVRLQKRLRGTGRAIAGAYHSHIRSPAVPSESDLQDAYYPEFVYLIVSVARPHEPEFRAWRIEAGTAAEIELTAVAEERAE